MANVNKIEQYNKGTVFPDSYEETYLATKHISDIKLTIPSDIFAKLKQKIEEKGLYFGEDSILRNIIAGQFGRQEHLRNLQSSDRIRNPSAGCDGGGSIVSVPLFWNHGSGYYCRCGKIIRRKGGEFPLSDIRRACGKCHETGGIFRIQWRPREGVDFL